MTATSCILSTSGKQENSVVSHSRKASMSMSGRGAGNPICEATPIAAFLLPDENSPQGNTYFSGYLCESADLPVFLYLLTQVSPLESVTCIIQLLIEHFYLIIFVHVYINIYIDYALQIFKYFLFDGGEPY